jgi:hypothetical protein
VVPRVAFEEGAGNTMTPGKPILYATVSKDSESEIRHLLIYLLDGARVTRLVELADGVEREIATGTQFEMTQKADALVQEWVTDHGFKYRPTADPAFEPLDRTISLAKKMGYTIIYDPRSQNFNPTGGRLNLTGAVPLTEWKGMTPKGGGGYVYALDGMKILARPTLPANHGLNMSPTREEVPAVLLKAAKALNTVGPFAEFILGGD